MTNQIKLMDNNTNIYKIILMLAWPAVVEQLLQTIVNYVDTAMVGAIGVNATAAIGVTSSTIWMLNGFMQAVGVGYSVQVARHIGAGETEEAKSVIRQAVLAVLVLGAGLSAILMFFIAPNLPILMKVEPEVAPMAESYLRIIGMSYVCNMALIVCSNIMRCAGDTKTPMKYNILTNLINVVGNFFLIYPSREIVLLGREMVLPRAGLGVAGAAISTAIAISFSGICMLRILFCRQSAVQISLTDNFKPQGHIIRQAARLGLPVAMERMTISMGTLVSTSMITGLGTMSLAAHQLASTGESLCYLPANGFSMAATTLVAQYLGGKEPDKAFLSSRWTLRLSVLTMIISSTAMFFCAAPILDLFTNEPEVIALGTRMLRIEAFAEPLLAVGVVIAGILHGAGDIRWPFYISLIGMWGVRLPTSYFMLEKLHWGLSSIWIAMIFDWLCRAIISLWRFYHKKWLVAWKQVN